MFNYFWNNAENIEEGLGYTLFSFNHFLEFFIVIVITVIITLIYKKKESKRPLIKKIIAALLIIDELWKHIVLIATNSWLPKYLPLHLCSFSIFIITYDAFFNKKNNQIIKNYLFALGLPAAFFALITPTWKQLPFLNFMHLHSYSVHILLITYSVMIFVGGEVHRSLKMIPKVLIFLLICAIPIYFVNKLLETNFMFLANGDGTPLALFEKWFGSHLIGFLFLVPLVIAIMYIPYKYKNIED